MRVLTWNIWGIPTEGHRSRHLAQLEAIREADPDVVFLQEVWTREARRRLTSLRGYLALTHLTAPRARPRGGLLTLVRERIVQSPPRVSFHPYGRPLLPRPATFSGLVNTVAEFVAQKGIQHVEATLSGRRCHLLNTHLECPDAEVPSSQLDDVDNRRTRRQASQLAQFVSALKSPSVLVGGDLNLPVRSAGLQALLNQLATANGGAPITDLSAGVGPVELPLYDARIDFVLGNLLAPVERRAYLDPGTDIPGRLSDHPGVLVEGPLRQP